MSAPFATELYKHAKQLFPAGTVETLVAAPSGPGGKFDPAVRLVHISGLEITCGEFASQNENFIAAAIRLRVALDNPRP